MPRPSQLIFHALLVGVAVAMVLPIAAAEPPVLPDVRERMRQFVENDTVSGVVTLVSAGGDVVHLDAVGFADIAGERAMRVDDMFWIASMTKPITATGVLILQDEEKLSVDDPVAKYLPAYANVETPEGKPAEITIRHLLTHTSGLANLTPEERAADPSIEEVAQILADKPLQFAPGSQWKYGSGLTVAGRVIEIVSGQSYEQFIRERILDPLQMNDTTFHLDRRQAERLATLYEQDDEDGSLVPGEHKYVSIDPNRPIHANPSGGLFSTARDVWRFYQTIADGGEWNGRRIVSTDAIEQMTSPQTGSLETGFTPGTAWGLGWCVIREPQGVTQALHSGSFGHGGAYGTQVWVDPTADRIYVLMVQRSDFGNSDGSDLRAAFQNAAAQALDSQ